MKIYDLSQLLYCLSHLKEGILQQKVVLVFLSITLVRHCENHTIWNSLFLQTLLLQFSGLSSSDVQVFWSSYTYIGKQTDQKGEGQATLPSALKFD